MRLRSLLLTSLFLPALFCQIPQPDGGAVEAGQIPMHWMTGGPNCIELPDWEVHQFNPDFFIIRESGCTNNEKPF